MSRYRKLMTICCVGVLALGLAACGGGGDSGPSTADHDALKEQLAAALADRDAAQATAAAAAAAQAEAEAAQAAAEAAQATAEAAEAAAEAARMAAEAAQASAESERDAANAASAAAMAAQAMAESERDAANAASDVAAAAQAAAEEAQATAQAAAEAARLAQGMAQSERDAANMAAADAQAAADAANAMAAQAQMNADDANARATASEADAAMKAQEAMDADARAMAAADAQATAEMAQSEAEAQRDTANEARDAALGLLDAGQQEAAAQVAAALQAQGEAEAARDAAVTARDEALEDKGAAELARDNAITERDALQGELDTALADDQTDADEIARLMGEVSDKQDEIDGLDQDIIDKDGEIAMKQGEIDDLNEEIDGDGTEANPGLKAQLAALQEKYDDLVVDQSNTIAAADRNERKARAAGVITAIGGTRTTTTETTAFAGVTGLEIKRDGSGTVTYKAAPKSYSGTGAASDPWSSTMLTSSTNTVVVYTDIEAPTAKPLTPELSAGSVDIDEVQVADRAKRVVVDAPPLVGTTLTVEGTTTDPGTFEGSYRGITGTFTCAADCTITNTLNDGVAVAGSDIEFAPDNQLATYQAPDTAYAYFGWWLNKPKDSSGAHGVDVFAGSTGTALGSGAHTAIEDTATYQGPAAGKFATRSYTAGVLSDAAVGHFTATATLNADFDTAGEPGTISGKVAGFDTEGAVDASGWEVTLRETAISDTIFGGNTAVTFGGPAPKAADDHGDWQGQFYDPAKRAADAPGTIVGTFDAVLLDGTASLAGAYGASKQ